MAKAMNVTPTNVRIIKGAAERVGEKCPYFCSASVPTTRAGSSRVGYQFTLRKRQLYA